MELTDCELCGSNRTHKVMQQIVHLDGVPSEEFTVVRCDNCALLYLNPRPTSSQISRYYPPTYYPATAPARRRISGGIKRWIREDFYGYPRLSGGGGWQTLRKVLLWPEKARRVIRGRNFLPWTGQGRLLDVGCSAGGNLASFQEQGWDVSGLDVSETAVKVARERFGDRIQLGDLISISYPSGSFDVVHFSHSLEHMYAPLKILKEAHRILADKGILVVTVPNAGSLECQLFGPWWEQWDLPRHLYHFDKTTLRGLLDRAGFQVVHSRTGVNTMFLMVTLKKILAHTCGTASLPRWVEKTIEKTIAKPICLITGHVGYGTEITVYGSKK